jgi:hypothetical protein
MSFACDRGIALTFNSSHANLNVFEKRSTSFVRVFAFGAKSTGFLSRVTRLAIRSTEIRSATAKGIPRSLF